MQKQKNYKRWSAKRVREKKLGSERRVWAGDRGMVEPTTKMDNVGSENRSVGRDGEVGLACPEGCGMLRNKSWGET